jgi:hypothetical protein
MDSCYPVREARIARCRDILLNHIKPEMEDEYALYIPIDLDSMIAQSLPVDLFLAECKRVATGEVDAVFPLSIPYYYDVFALRAKGWVHGDCWAPVGPRPGKSSLIELCLTIRHVYSKQKHQREFEPSGLLVVDSAFGGFGIYRACAIGDAHYLKDELLNGACICEHVIFNRSIPRKAISQSLRVAAPLEHIAFRLSSRWRQIALIAKASYSDLNALFSAAPIMACHAIKIVARQLVRGRQ